MEVKVYELEETRARQDLLLYVSPAVLCSGRPVTPAMRSFCSLAFRLPDPHVRLKLAAPDALSRHRCAGAPKAFLGPSIEEDGGQRNPSPRFWGVYVEDTMSYCKWGKRTCVRGRRKAGLLCDSNGTGKEGGTCRESVPDPDRYDIKRVSTTRASTDIDHAEQ